MTDPKRIIHGPLSTLEAALLHSMLREVPPAKGKARMLTLLGISAGGAGAAALATVSANAAVTAATASAKATTTTALALTAKWVVVSMAGAALAVGVAHEIKLPDKARPVPVASHISAQANPSTLRPTRAGAPDANKAVEPSELAAPVASAVHGIEKGSSRRFADLTTAENPRNLPNLADEVATLDKAQAAASAGDPTRTLRLLDSYQRQYPHGNLGPEAQLLRIEALVQNGQSAVALPIARRMLKDAPTGPHAERIRSLLPAADSTASVSNLRSMPTDPATSQ